MLSCFHELPAFVLPCFHVTAQLGTQAVKKFQDRSVPEEAQEPQVFIPDPESVR